MSLLDEGMPNRSNCLLLSGVQNIRIINTIINVPIKTGSPTNKTPPMGTILGTKLYDVHPEKTFDECQKLARKGFKPIIGSKGGISSPLWKDIHCCDSMSTRTWLDE